MGPTKPAGRRGFEYICNFTDDCAKMKEAFNVNVAVAFLHNKIDDDIFLKAFPGHELIDAATGVPVTMKLKSSQYGLSQSPGLCHYTIGKGQLSIG